MLDPSTSQVIHIKMKSLIIDHLISKLLGGGGRDSYHLKYYLPQDKGDESNPITFLQYLANITEKMVKHVRYQLIHAISRDNDATTVHFIYFPHHKVEETQVLNGLPCILSEDLLVNPNYYMTISEIEIYTMGI